MAYQTCAWPCSYEEVCFGGRPEWLSFCVLVPSGDGGCNNC